MNQQEDEQIIDLSDADDQFANAPDAAPDADDQIAAAPDADDLIRGQSAVEERFTGQLPGGEQRAEPLVTGKAALKRPKGRRSFWKPLWIGLAALLVISLVFGVLNQSPGKKAVSTTKVETSRNVSATATSASKVTSTPQVSSTPVGPTSLTPGPLILLNPGIVRLGSSLSVTGSGFGARSTIDIVLKQGKSGPNLASTFVQADKNGTFSGASLAIPSHLGSGAFIVQAHQRNSGNLAQATGAITGGAPQVKLGTQVGNAGDVITLSLSGFGPNEVVNTYWNNMEGQPIATQHTDGGGSVGQASIQVPFGAVGTNTFLFVGTKSREIASASFLMLSLYPTVTVSRYTIQADNSLSFSGNGFGPREQVLVYLNNPNDQPIAVIQSDANGAFSRAGSFDIPFSLKGRQTLIFIGEQSRASSTVNFMIMPYQPNVQPSTYGGFPGTTVTFYATGFARNEVVHVYVGRTQNSPGTMVSCFSADKQGNAAAAGSYVIPGNAKVGPLLFTLIGSKSGGIATASMQVAAAPNPVQTPSQQPFTCPLDKAAS